MGEPTEDQGQLELEFTPTGTTSPSTRSTTSAWPVQADVVPAITPPAGPPASGAKLVVDGGRLVVPAGGPAGALEQVLLRSRRQDPVATYLASLGSPESRRTITGTLERLAQLLTGRTDVAAAAVPWHLLRAGDTTAIRAELIATYAPSTTRKMLSALAGVLKQCWRLGLIERDDYARTIDWGTVDGTTLGGAEAGRHVEPGELTALFTSCATDPRPATGARDAAALAVLFGDGLRRAEAVALDLADYTRTGPGGAGGQLAVDGKGNRARIAPCGTGTWAALDAWIEIRGTEPGPLLVAVNKAGRIDPALGRLSTAGLYGIVRRRAETAGIARFSPHDGRRTFAGQLFDANADLAAVQQLMGHANASITAYDRRPAAAKARAAGLIHLPYVAPARTTTTSTEAEG